MPAAVSIRPELVELHVADPPARWEALGFAVAGQLVNLGGISVRLGAEGAGITSWAVRGIAHTDAIDGLPTTPASNGVHESGVRHPNGATGIDHVVVVTPDFDRTSRALAQAGMGLRRIQPDDASAAHSSEAGSRTRGSLAAGSFRQGFRRLGPAILELVEADTALQGPARFWGFVVIVDDLEALSVRLGEHLGPIKPAVQAGRQIATLRSSAGVSEAVAFMSPAS